MTNLVKSLKDLQNPAILDMLEVLTGSRLAILDKSGYMAFVGRFITEANGLLFSNSSYRESARFLREVM